MACMLKSRNKEELETRHFLFTNTGATLQDFERLGGDDTRPSGMLRAPRYRTFQFLEEAALSVKFRVPQTQSEQRRKLPVAVAANIGAVEFKHL